MSRLLIIFFLLVIAFSGYSQGWEKLHQIDDDYTSGYDIVKTPDGGYMLLCFVDNNWGLIKLDDKGDTIWTKNSGIFSGSPYRLLAAPQNRYAFTVDASDRLYLVDSVGNVLNTTDVYFGPQGCGIRGLVNCIEGGFAASGYHNLAGGIESEFVLIRYDDNGDTLWTKQYPTGRYDVGMNLVQMPDSGFMMVGYTFDYSPSGYGTGLLMRTDKQGNLIWEKHSDYGFDYRITTIKRADDSTFYTYASGGYGLHLEKHNANGDTIWSSSINGDTATWYSTMWGGIAIAPNGNVGVVGKSVENLGGNQVEYMVVTACFSASGDSLWLSQHGFRCGNLCSEKGLNLVPTSSNGFVAVGYARATDTSKVGAFVVKVDSNGVSYSNIIEGYVYTDQDTNCQYNLGETTYGNRLIKVEPGPRYTLSDTSGYFKIRVDTGTQTITHVEDHPYWGQDCPSYTLTLPSFFSTIDSIDFSRSINYFCPDLEVDIATWALRPCFQSTYHVSYCNNGTVAENNTYIAITFDSVITPSSATLTWDSVVGDAYYFEIGMLQPKQCGGFYITVDVACNATLASTHCVVAEIYPKFQCLPPPLGYDSSRLVVNGVCADDSLACFTIYNVGSDMNLYSTYNLYINDEMVQTDSFMLSAGDSLVICIGANGNTVVLECAQSPYYLGNSRPIAFVEMCGNPVYKFGIVNQFPQDDEAADVEIDCRQLTASMDPNDKQAFPTGVSIEHYTKPNQQLEYFIRFQNTGTDTAFNVTIRDTISQLLNIETINILGASHSFTHTIREQGIVEWTFANILLPDSNINELASHG
ncbi:MAG: hypothetical protein JKY18_05545, partial [Flavobacteriales bacterium]|nr:hypothetical protein [Flavobacteriales bacterium]